MAQQTDTERNGIARPVTSRTVARGAIATVAAALALSSPAVAAAATAAPSASPAASATATGGTLRAWGYNFIGQLGDGTTTDSLTPVRVKLPTGTKIISVRGGCNHSVALTTKGHVWAWGFNNHGQLGDGTTNDSDTPVRVRFAAGTKITSVRAGCDFSIAITTKGHVLAWGQDGDGQLGDGGTSDSDTPVRVRLPAGTKVKSITAGADDALAISTSGRLYAWGGNADGEIGDGTTTDTDTPVRVSLPAGTRTKIVSAGGRHNLALSTAGQLYAWGYNGDGEFGNGTTAGSVTPVAVAFPAAGAIKSLVAGCFHSLALTSDGVVLAWGLNSDGELGNASNNSSSLPVAAELPAGTHVKSISAGCINSYARTAKGHVLAWGYAADGQLGDGTTSDSEIPVRVALATGLKAIAIGSGPTAEHSFAIVRKKP
jgi:alpha-tubulin suppressor-like RCC1 family protein